MSNVVKAFVFMQDNGDGSTSPLYFPSAAARDKYAEKQDVRFCDDCFDEEFTIEDGVLKPTFGWMEDEDDLEDDGY